MPLWLAVVLLILTGAGLALCRRYLRGNKTAYILCTLFCVLLALACIVYSGLSLLLLLAVPNPPRALFSSAAPTPKQPRTFFGFYPPKTVLLFVFLQCSFLTFPRFDLFVHKKREKHR